MGWTGAKRAPSGGYHIVDAPFWRNTKRTVWRKCLRRLSQVMVGPMLVGNMVFKATPGGPYGSQLPTSLVPTLVRDSIKQVGLLC